MLVLPSCGTSPGDDDDSAAGDDDDSTTDDDDSGADDDDSTTDDDDSAAADDDDSAPGDDDDSSSVPYPAGVFINEIHYDNEGSDTNEGVEIAGPAGIDLAGWSLVLYDGADGTFYDTIVLSGIIDDEVGGFGALNFLTPGIQDGSPDGVALMDDGGLLVEFLSYEGSFNSTDGVVGSLISEPIGVEQTPVPATDDQTLQRTGTGCFDRHQPVPSTFVWAGPTAQSRGEVNAGQVFDCDY